MPRRRPEPPSPLLALLLAALLSGCQGLRPAAAPDWLAPLPAASLGEALVAVQKLDFQRGDQRHIARIHLEVLPPVIALVAATAGGQPLFTLRQDGAQRESERAGWLPDALQAEQVLRELQLVFWPLAPLQAALAEGLRLQETGQGSERRRRLWQGDTLLLDIRYGADNPWAAPVQLHNHRWHYRYRIDTLQLERP